MSVIELISLRTRAEEGEVGMLKLNFIWKENKAQYRTGESLYLNRICIGSYGWNSSRSQGVKDDSITWVGQIALPSLSDTGKRVYGSNPTEIKPKIEQVIENWFKEALAKVKEE